MIKELHLEHLWRSKDKKRIVKLHKVDQKSHVATVTSIRMVPSAKFNIPMNELIKEYEQLWE